MSPGSQAKIFVLAGFWNMFHFERATIRNNPQQAIFLLHSRLDCQRLRTRQQPKYAIVCIRQLPIHPAEKEPGTPICLSSPALLSPPFWNTFYFHQGVTVPLFADCPSLFPTLPLKKNPKPSLPAKREESSFSRRLACPDGYFLKRRMGVWGATPPSKIL